MELIIISLIFGGITSYAATQKNRSGVGWFIIGSLLGIIGLILIAFTKPLPEQA